MVRRFALAALLGLALVPSPVAWAAGDAAPAQAAVTPDVSAGPSAPAAASAAPTTPAAPATASTAPAVPSTAPAAPTSESAVSTTPATGQVDATTAPAAPMPDAPPATAAQPAPATGSAPASSAAPANASAAPAAPATAPAAPADASAAPATAPAASADASAAPAAPADSADASAAPTAPSTPSPASAAPAAADSATAPASAPVTTPQTATAPASDTTPATAPADTAAASAATGAAAAPAASAEAQAASEGPADGAGTAQTTADKNAAAADDASASGDDTSDQSQSSTLDLLNEDNADSAPNGADSADSAQPDTGNDAAGTAAAPPGNPADSAGLPAESNAAALTPPQEEAPTSTAENPAEGNALFPSSPGIEKQKAFWIKIFTRYNSYQGVIHDGRIALPVFESLDLTGLHYRAQRRTIRRAKRELAGRLRELARAVQAGTPLNAKQQTLLAKIPPDSSPRDIREYAENLRFQRGLADRFRKGLVRSGALLKPMRAILARYGVPKDLVYLPHVESSFNNRTRSKFGAAGIWQFTRGTGRLYMTVNYEVDERLDPIIASRAAAKFLRQNYDRLGTWPLAITAYNHGPQSMERIVHRLHTHNLAEIIKDYDGYLFGFASKNFYAEFLAAREVARHYERYFGPLTLDPTLHFAKVELPGYTDVHAVTKALGIDEAQLRKLNPALRSSVWSGAKYIPPSYALRIPPDRKPARLLAAIQAHGEHAHQKRSLYVRVVRGDTLYGIGRRNGISWRAIAAANNIDRYHRLMPGQKLILPWKGKVPPAAIAAAARASRNQAVDPPKQALADAQVVAHIPVTDPAGSGKPGQGGKLDPLADRFQNLRVQHYNSARQQGEIVAAYGETVGGYAQWAGVTASEIRRLNGMRYGNVLRPGETYTIPLDAVGPQQFEQRRLAFHRQREKSFFAQYDIKEKVKVEVRRGQSPWDLAQNNNVPMWLFYHENPQLLTEPMRAGMQVILPVLQSDDQSSH